MAPPISALPLPELDDPLDFSFPPLQSLDSSLRCQICHELFTAPVMLTTCSHTFDSLCLRNHLREIKKCPQCSIEANEDRIRRNLIVEELVNNWRKSRPHLISLEATSLEKKSLESPSLSPSPSTSRARQTVPGSQEFSISTRQSSKRKLAQQTSLSPPSATSKKRVKQEAQSEKAIVIPDDNKTDDQQEDASSDIEVIEDFGTRDSSRKKRPSRDTPAAASKRVSRSETKTQRRGTGKGKEEELTADIQDPTILVTCPLCQRSVKNGQISAHVDSNCSKYVFHSLSGPGDLAGVMTPNAKGAKGAKGNLRNNAFGRLMAKSQSNNGYSSSDDNATALPSSTAALADTTKYLALPNYAHKKLREIENLLKDLNLSIAVPTNHSKTPEQKIAYLKKRHSQFLTLWNANADIDPGIRGNGGHKSAKELRGELQKWEKILLEEEKEQNQVRGGKLKGVGGGGGGGLGTLNSNGQGQTNRESQASQGNDFKTLIELARASHLKDKEKRERDKEPESEGGEELSSVRAEEAGSRHEQEEGKNEATKHESVPPKESQSASAPEPVTTLGEETKGIPIEVAGKEEDGLRPNIHNDITSRQEFPQDGARRLPISPPPQEAEELDRALAYTGQTTRNSASAPPSKSVRRTVRIQTPPPAPPLITSSSPLTTSKNTTLKSEREDVDDADEDSEETERQLRSSSILEYDEKYFPPSSQRVREVDWDMIRRAREEEEADFGEEE